MADYDVIIVGAGPAGIFNALELVKSNTSLSILILDKGKELDKRFCLIQKKEENKKCVFCAPCSLLSGWGGAGAFSDGKLTLSPEVGGSLHDYVGDKIVDYISYTDNLYLEFGAPEKIYGQDEEVLHQLRKKAILGDLTLVPAPIRHLGTDICFVILKKIETFLQDKVKIRCNAEVKKIILKDGEISGVQVSNDEFISAKYVIVCPGREGSAWFNEEATRLNLGKITNPVDVGVRVELPAEIAEPMTQIYESKFIFYSRQFDDRVRTFCMCPNGEVVAENSDGVVTVNGHSYSDTKSNNTNFAILVSKSFTDPFKEPILYGKYIARLANLLGGGVMVQRLGDLHAGRRSTPDRIRKGTVKPTLEGATPGDLSLVFPYRYLSGIIEMIKALDVVAPGINSKNTLLYGVEVKFYSSRISLSKTLETKIKNMFAAGDGVGITRGLMQSSASGIIVAREIIRREKENG